MRAPKTTDGADSPRLACRRCGRELHPGRGDNYVVSILAVADPWPPVFTEDDLALDVEQEIQRLLARMRDLDAQQAQDQVYSRLIFHMCESCYLDWIIDPTGS
ncbi:MAG: hypothetical protein ACHRXM_27845 [Isosphaerales bacterium]